MSRERRLELHEKLCKILGSRNVYFQPPGTVRMNYPCIRYERDRGQHTYADNRTYIYRQAYQLTYIDKDPDSDIPEKLIESFEEINFNRHYVADNLNHDVLILYY
jgi:hypothetical protein